MTSFDELLKVLAHLCQGVGGDDDVSYEAAITFGKICVKNEHAVNRMMDFLTKSQDTHKKAKVT